MTALDHYRNFPPETVVSVSGGRTSGYLLWKIVEANSGLPAGSVACFQNTGLEMPETLDFVRRLGDYLGVDIVWLERDAEPATKIRLVDFHSAARDGRPFVEMFTRPDARKRNGTIGLRELPHPRGRSCTNGLKMAVMNAFCRKHLGWGWPYYNALGFRADEPRRVESRIKAESERDRRDRPKGLFPLYHAGVDQEEVLSFWEKAPFDLQVDPHGGNCDFCFMKGIWRIKELMKKYPERAERWIAMEERSGAITEQFRDERPSYRKLLEEVTAGNMSAANDQLFCGTCSDE